MSKDIKKALEHCIEWNCDNCPNREELGSGETVCRGRLLPEVLEYVADLEAKLAEKQKENATLEAMLVENANDRKTMQEFKIGKDEYDLTDEDARNSLCWEVEELKQQLAEKEEELKYYETLLKRQCNECKDQYKISFCIEKLEKVKELMRNIDMPNKPELYNNDMFGAGFDSHYIRVEKLIENQINELKGKVEDVKD